MQRYKSFVLPVSLVAGYFLREFCAVAAVSIPYVIFAILILTFSGVKISRLRPSKLDMWVALFQVIVSFSAYHLMLVLSGDVIVAQGAMMCVLCPVASSVTVVASMLGANPVRTTTYTIAGNLLVSLVAPLYFTLIGTGEGVSAVNAFVMILCKIAVIIALPFFVMFVLQRYVPKVNDRISEYKQWSFYLWSFSLFVTIGQTADFVVLRWQGDINEVIWLGGVSMAICFMQFSLGRIIGRKYGDRIGGGQLLAQKNSAMGIWMINTFLNPLASVAMAFYSIWQNVFNSWQIYRHSVAEPEKS